MTEERPSATTLRGNPLTLVGIPFELGDVAPDFELSPASPAITPIVTGGLPPVRLSKLGVRSCY
jgi:hypothetical protein